MRRFVPLAIALTALALIPVQSANAAAANTCDGLKTQITGGSKAEKFTLTQTKQVINSHGGNDVIDLHGSGNDILRADGSGPEAVPIRYVDGGKGFDTAEIYVCFEGDAGPKWTIRDVERITIVNCLD